MPFETAQQKVTASHLARTAYLYVRQSTLRQVVENTESTKRQYALREKALALGWPVDSITVVDNDLGQSGAQAADREGFQRLVADVGLGKAGIVLSLEVSRLARNSSDWHRLLELCALSDTLIADEDGVYNPAQINDRLLLGMKGTMSEFELHVLKARLHGGILNKARRGELKIELPIGFVHTEKDEVQLDPDQQVQQTIKLFFDTFTRTGTAFSACRELRQKKVQFPRKIIRGPHRGEVVWDELTYSRTLQILHNPCYAGVYCYGRTRTRKMPDGTSCFSRIPRNEWVAFIPNAHPGYISLEQFEDNKRRLHESAQAQGSDRRKSPPREGPALLQGMMLCGVCGNRMTVRYYSRGGKLVPEYVCCRAKVQQCLVKPCQTIPGAGIDKCISELLVETVSPLAVQIALSVQDELQSRFHEAAEIRKKHFERLRYEAELARRRYLRVDPDNRLVAASLEADWNQKLRGLTELQTQYEQESKADQLSLSQQQREQILALPSDFPKLWNSLNANDRERKRLLRLIIEDVTLRRGSDIQIHVRFKGGATKSISLPLPQNSWQLRQTSPEAIAEFDRLLDDHTYPEIAALLNEKGFRTGAGKYFDPVTLKQLKHVYDLKSRYDRMRERGFITAHEIADVLGVPLYKIHELRKDGYLKGYPVSCRREVLFLHPDQKTRKTISRLPYKPIGHPGKSVR
jgi:DNA invertase Pin-like site-specific DNA recombinase